MHKVLGLAALSLMLAPPALAQAVAQEDGEYTRLENVQWYMVEYLTLKPDKVERAHEIMNKYFRAPDVVAFGPDFLELRSYTGKHDVIAIFPINEPNDVGWISSPKDQAWMAKFIEVVGDKEKAMAIWAEFNSYILVSEKHIMHRVLSEAAE